MTRLLPSLTDQLAAVASSVASATIDDPALFRLTGSDGREALERIVTQQVGALGPGEGSLSLLLAPKGQFRALMAVFGADDGLLLLAPPGRGDGLAAALGKYLAFSRSRLEPVPSGHGGVVVGPRWRETAQSCGADADRLAAGGWQTTGGAEHPVWWFGQTFLGVPGALVLGESAEALAVVQRAVEAVGGMPVSNAALEVARIDAGWPAWGHELTESVLPPEVGLDESAVSYTKGCYVGQETMARMKTYGHPTRCLVRLAQSEGPEQAPELPLPVVLEGGTRHGEVTSFATHPERGGIALGLVRREGADAGTVWLAEGRRFTVVSASPA